MCFAFLHLTIQTLNEYGFFFGLLPGLPSLMPQPVLLKGVGVCVLLVLGQHCGNTAVDSRWALVG